VDQIQDYAVHHHRPFVMNHLEAWHARHQKTLKPCKEAVREINTATSYTDVAHERSDITDFDSSDISNDSFMSEMGDFDSDDSDSSSYDFDEIAELFGIGPSKPAECLRLKEQSKNATREMANETRKRNRSLKIAQAPKSTKEPEKTRPRGRPRKAGLSKKEVPNGGTGRLLERARPRGRPPKAEVAKKEAPKGRRERPPKIANKTIKTALTQ
jgi:hypothetical protein